MKEFDTLLDDVRAMFDDGCDITGSVGDFSVELANEVTERFKEYGNDRSPTLRMSNLGKPLRQLYYELKGYKGEKLSSSTKLKFLYGNLIEHIFLYLAEQSGHKVEYRQHKVEYSGISGSIDAVIDGVLVDVKSCSTRSFDKFDSGSLLEDDPFGYVGQLTGYKKAGGYGRAAFIAIDKTLGNMCTFELPSLVSDNYDLDGRISRVQAALASDVLPEKCYEDVVDGKSGNLKLSVGCSYCSYKFECHKDANDGQGLKVYSYSYGPRYLTKVVREPKVDIFPMKESA